MGKPTCPKCESANVRGHCRPHHTTGRRLCRWFRCADCGATLDPANRRGLDREHAPFRY